MKSQAWRDLVCVSINVAIAALILQTWLVMGWIVPVAVSGSSMAPALLGPHRMYRCDECRREFAVGFDQLPLAEKAVCDACGRRSAQPIGAPPGLGARLAVDRTAYLWRSPRRWETVVFRCPDSASDWCVKRVVGLPGEAISLAGGDVFINGKVARKALKEQRSVRQPVDVPDDHSSWRDIHLGDVVCRASPRWRQRDANRIEFHRFADGPITDETSYNQAATPPLNRVSDIMLTFEAQLQGAGEFVLAAASGTNELQVVVDLARRGFRLQTNDHTIVAGQLPASIANRRVVEWTFSLFDRQALLAIGDQVVFAEPVDPTRAEQRTAEPPFAIVVHSLIGEIRRIGVWRDVYYAVRHGDGPRAGNPIVRGVSDADSPWSYNVGQTGGTATRSATAPTAAWRLGSQEYYVLGDNAAISDDSRSWLSGPGLEAKLLIGKPFGVR